MFRGSVMDLRCPNAALAVEVNELDGRENGGIDDGSRRGRGGGIISERSEKSDEGLKGALWPGEIGVRRNPFEVGGEKLAVVVFWWGKRMEGIDGWLIGGNVKSGSEFSDDAGVGGPLEALEPRKGVDEGRGGSGYIIESVGAAELAGSANWRELERWCIWELRCGGASSHTSPVSSATFWNAGGA
jgi:hypothetical protein